MRPFDSPGDGSGTYVAGLSTPERLVLAQVTGDVVELLGGEESFFPGLDERGEEPRDSDPGDSDPGDSDSMDAAGEATGNNAAGGAVGEAFGDAAAPRRDARGSDTGADVVHGTEAAAEAISALRSIFEGIEGAPVEAPADPAVRRLLPDASSDPEIAGEFRRYTDDDLRQRKVERLLLFAELLLEVPPSPDESDQLDFVVLVDEAEAIAGALADIRLVIGERLGLRSDLDSEELYDAVTATWESADDDPAEDPGDDGGREAPRRDTAGEGTSGPRLFLGSVFLLAGYLQESLTDCLLTDFRRRKKRR
ncbi:protein of unknown function [Sanguibacter gelidistatuariae]|uniref:Uncharacterized protein n=1 Tax=Sanguibacter gelidistatuariae TaxID=1814289 RepID=A0A1G6N2V7_9MICO|nr:DUF2017 family protein [Sanguibacter gelidistatuariae]SDC61566.1 protein of unknown function [Sanguibacter gelidistatuariae]